MQSWQVPPDERTPTDVLDIFRRTLYGEARSEPLVGVVAVANVAMQRVRRGGWWGGDVAAVCLSKAQFSCWSEAEWNARNLAAMHAATLADPAFVECDIVARLAMADALRDITGGATHYHTLGTRPGWANVLQPTRVIGRHKFYIEETWQAKRYADMHGEEQDDEQTNDA